MSDKYFNRQQFPVMEIAQISIAFKQWVYNTRSEEDDNLCFLFQILSVFL